LARVFQPEKLYPEFVKPFDVRAVGELSVSADIEPVPPLALKVTVYEVGGGDPPPPPPPPPPDGTVVVVVGGLGGAGGTTTTVVAVLTVTAFETEEFGPVPNRLSASTVKR
jgi:Mrp family chromosome partitioning ATPase